MLEMIINYFKNKKNLKLQKIEEKRIKMEKENKHYNFITSLPEAPLEILFRSLEKYCTIKYNK